MRAFIKFVFSMTMVSLGAFAFLAMKGQLNIVRVLLASIAFSFAFVPLRTSDDSDVASTGNIALVYASLVSLGFGLVKLSVWLFSV